MKEIRFKYLSTFGTFYNINNIAVSLIINGGQRNVPSELGSIRFFQNRNSLEFPQTVIEK